ncbi:MAG: indolepyruvate oxidoreductase subunit beta [Methanobacteriota archaeon]|nr:MAG: indolepyruvate oxidoreductase subunit beta [Euryarchaeota archaeon]
MTVKEFNILMCGVGGQGLVMLSKVIGDACARAGIRAITGEQHGLSQRSGSINIHLRIGEQIRSPLIPVGGADVILALEALEALRCVEYLRDDGIVIMNSRVQHPVWETESHVKDEKAKSFSAEDVKTRLLRVTDKVAALNALDIAKSVGNPLTENIVMLGALSTLEDLWVPEGAVVEAIRINVPKKAIDVNLRALKLGKGAAHSDLCNVVKCKE